MGRHACQDCSKHSQKTSHKVQSNSNGHCAPLQIGFILTGLIPLIRVLIRVKTWTSSSTGWMTRRLRESLRMLTQVYFHVKDNFLTLRGREEKKTPNPHFLAQKENIFLSCEKRSLDGRHKTIYKVARQAIRFRSTWDDTRKISPHHPLTLKKTLVKAGATILDFVS